MLRWSVTIVLVIAAVLMSFTVAKELLLQGANTERSPSSAVQTQTAEKTANTSVQAPPISSSGSKAPDDLASVASRSLSLASTPARSSAGPGTAASPDRRENPVKIGRFAPIKINFQPPATKTPEGYLADTGVPFGLKENGYTYGWVDGPATESRGRNVHPDKRYDTFIHLTKGPSQLGPHQNPPSAPGGSDGADHIWSISIPNGTYRIELVMGDPVYKDHINNVLINGVPYPDPQSGDFTDLVATLKVEIGSLTIRAGPDARNPTVCFIHIERLAAP